MRLSLQLTIGASIILTAYACGGGPPPPPPGPDPDSLAAAQQRTRDSLDAARRAAEEEARRAREAEEAMRRAAADSLARVRRETEEVRNMFEAMINFDYDRSDIRDEDARALDLKVAIMQANPNLRIQINGHCDERGSDEYNIALGNRRALAAKQYMVDRGIAESRISTSSFGEERPLPGTGANEDDWARNRRDEFSISAGGNQLMRPRM